MNTEAFVYKWTLEDTGEYYVGIHKGHVDDGYVGSGKLFLEKWNKTNVNQWKREILYSGSYSECKQKEKTLVSKITLNDLFCLNLVMGGGGGCRPLGSKSGYNKTTARVKPQNIIVRGKEFDTRMQAIKYFNITFEELDKENIKVKRHFSNNIWR